MDKKRMLRSPSRKLISGESGTTAYEASSDGKAGRFCV